MAFQKAKPELTSLKFAFEGPPKGGKTFTALLCAEGLAKLENKKIAVVDSENHGTDFYAKDVPARKVHPKAFEFDAIYTRSLAIMKAEVLALDPKVYGVVVIDSMTHFWEAAIAAYDGPKQGGAIPLNAWGAIKAPYRAVMDWLMANRIHVFIVGREATMFEEDQDGKMVVTGKKMRAEGNTAYEVDTLVRIESVIGARSNKLDKKTKKKSAIERIPTAFIDGDRSGVLVGQVIEWPTYQNLVAPIVPLLDRESSGRKIETAAEATATDALLFADERADKAQGSKKLRETLVSKLEAAGKTETVEALGAEIAAKSGQLLPEDLGALRTLYKDKKASTSTEKVADQERARLTTKICRALDGWPDEAVVDLQKKHLHGRSGEWSMMSLVELRKIDSELDKMGPPALAGTR